MSVKYVNVYVVPKGDLFEVEMQLDISLHISLRECIYCVHGLLVVMISTYAFTQQTVTVHY